MFIDPKLVAREQGVWHCTYMQQAHAPAVSRVLCECCGESPCQMTSPGYLTEMEDEMINGRKCRCGARLKTTTTFTRQYGGVTDTFEECVACGYSEVFV